MKRFTLLLLFMLALTAPAFAQDALMRTVSSLDLSAGMRFEPGVGRHADTENQFYVGAGFRVPIAARARLFAEFDRDFIDSPKWAARTGVSFSPFGE